MRPHSTTLPPQDPLFVAYLAGLVDGEGCFHVRRQIRRGGRYHEHVAYVPAVMIANTYRPVLEQIATRLECGTVYRTHPRIHRWEEAFAYHACGINAIKMAEIILPYCQIKRRQAELLVTFPLMGRLNQHTVTGDEAAEVRQEQERLYWEISKLNNPYGFKGRGSATAVADIQTA